VSNPARNPMELCIAPDSIEELTSRITNLLGVPSIEAGGSARERIEVVPVELCFGSQQQNEPRTFERGSKAANPPRGYATGRLRHRRYWLQCPSITLRVGTRSARFPRTLRRREDGGLGIGGFGADYSTLFVRERW